MKLPNMKAARKRLTDISYCIYRYGFERGQLEQSPMGFQEFCHNIKQIHEKGKKIWRP